MMVNNEYRLQEPESQAVHKTIKGVSMNDLGRHRKGSSSLFVDQACMVFVTWFKRAQVPHVCPKLQNIKS